MSRVKCFTLIITMIITKITIIIIIKNLIYVVQFDANQILIYHNPDLDILSEYEGKTF